MTAALHADGPRVIVRGAAFGAAALDPRGPRSPSSSNRLHAIEVSGAALWAAPTVLAELVGRSSSAITQRMRRLGLRDGRSPHHPLARRGALTPGEHATAVRELRAAGPGRAFAVARRLDVSPAVIRAAAAQSTSPDAVLAQGGDL